MSPVMLDLPALHAGQRRVRNTIARFKLIRCGRRWGKTTLAAVACVEVALGVAYWHHRCHVTDGTPTPGVAWWVPPTYKIAAIGWRVIESLARALQKSGVPVNILRGEMTIEFPNGGRIVVRSADSPAGLRGDGLDFIVVEEAAFIPSDAWGEALRPALADRKGEAWFITTPAGFNWFYELEQRAHTLDDWQVFHAPTSDNPNIDPVEVEAMRREMGPVEFQQEVLAEYVDDQTQPFKRTWFKYYDRLPKGPRGVRYADVDLAVSLKESADFTVVASVEKHPDGNLYVLDIIRERIPAPDLVPTLDQTVRRWDLSWVGIEKAGYQLSAVQLARRAGLPVRELKPDRDKVARSIPLQVMMEGGQVRFPKDAPWLREVESELLMFPAGEHDDIVDALSYAAIDATRIPSYATY